MRNWVCFRHWATLLLWLAVAFVGGYLTARWALAQELRELRAKVLALTRRERSFT